MTSSKDIPEFDWADYLVFSMMLVISAVIGLFTVVRHRKASATQLLTANRKLPMFPVAMSLATSFLSAVTVLGVPAEVYYNSAEYWLIGVFIVIGHLISGYAILPVIYRLKITSGYQYLEFRFNRAVRLLGSTVFILLTLLYMAVVLFAPSLALSQVTSLSMDASILATGIVCTLYTALLCTLRVITACTMQGGIKAVVWTDTFQTLVIVSGYFVLILRGIWAVGSWSEVMDRVHEGQRFTWEIDWDPNPFVRHTFWTLLAGGLLITVSIVSANQTSIQRFISMPTLKKAKGSILILIVMTQVLLALAILTGMVMYAYYYQCDPLKRGLVKKADQLIPLFVMQVLGDVPGLPGLFVACIYSAALSTVSSGVNSLAAVVLEDFYVPFSIWRGKEITERAKSIFTVVSAVVFGLMTVGMAYLAGVVGQAVLQLALSILGMVGGPLLGLMVQGIFLPCVNSWGAGLGLISGLVISLWTGMGAIVLKVRSISDSPPLNDARMCMNATFASPLNMTTTAASSFLNATDIVMTSSPPSSSDEMYSWYQLSYQHYSTVSFLLSTIVAIIASAITGFNKRRPVDRRLYHDVLCCFRKENMEAPTEDAEKNGAIYIIENTKL